MKLNKCTNRFAVNHRNCQISDQSYDKLINQIINQIEYDAFWKIYWKTYDLIGLNKGELYETK